MKKALLLLVLLASCAKAPKTLPPYQPPPGEPSGAVMAQKPKQATIVVTPGSVIIPVGTSQQFIATTTGTTKLPVWTATGGAITINGLYTAGQVPGTYTVVATLPANVRNSATVTVTSVVDNTPPAPPTNLTVANRTQTSYDLRWSPSISPDTVGYGVYAPATGPLVNVVTGAGASFSGEACGTSMTIAIDAFDAAGNRSTKVTIQAQTLACVDTTPPSPPTGLTAAATQTAATLNWTASPSTDTASYGVYQNAVLKQSVTGTTATISGLACGQTYIFAVDAVDTAGNRSTTKASLSVPMQACTPPVMTPTTLLFNPPIDYATNVTSCAVELRLAGTATTSTPIATRNLGKPAAVGGEVSVDISTLVDPLPAGTYYGIVVSIGPGGSTPSLPSAPFTK